MSNETVVFGRNVLRWFKAPYYDSGDDNFLGSRDQYLSGPKVPRNETLGRAAFFPCALVGIIVIEWTGKTR